MFTVKTPAEAEEILRETVVLKPGIEEIPLTAAAGRVLARPVTAREYVPDFNRSTVDGYAVKASDTFGCSEGLPALLIRTGEVRMGQAASVTVSPGDCVYVPTGGEVPEGADAVVMVEYTEEYGDGTIGILRPCAPGENMIFRGDDLKPGQEVFPAGIRLHAKEIGALSSMGAASVPVRKKVRAAIISTGDELIPAELDPGPGQIRDVNSALLGALVEEAGAEAVRYGIVPDRREELQEALRRAVTECDLVLISGGSSVGTRDLTCRILEEEGRILFHGISMKPGKPTIFGLARRSGREESQNRPEAETEAKTMSSAGADAPENEGSGAGDSSVAELENGIPVFGLPGHPGAAFFVAEIFIRPILRKIAALPPDPEVKAVLRENLSANHGRAQYTAALLETENGTVYARPVYMKSGMITGIAGADGYFCVSRDTEGLPAGAEVTVITF